MFSQNHVYTIVVLSTGPGREYNIYNQSIFMKLKGLVANEHQLPTGKGNIKNCLFCDDRLLIRTCQSPATTEIPNHDVKQ